MDVVTQRGQLQTFIRMRSIILAISSMNALALLKAMI